MLLQPLALLEGQPTRSQEQALMKPLALLEWHEQGDPLLGDQLLVPMDLQCCQGNPGVVLQAPIRQLPPVLAGRFVSDHLVFHVKPPLLFDDPVQTVLCLLCCRQVPTSCCSCELALASAHLVTEALAIVLEVAERADLKIRYRSNQPRLLELAIQALTNAVRSHIKM